MTRTHLVSIFGAASVRRLLCVAPVLVAIAFAAPLVKAGPLVPLGPGGSVASVGAPVPVGGGVIASKTVTVTSLPDGLFDATLTSLVWAGDPSNPYGGLDFIYILTNEAVSADENARLTINNYAGFLTDVGFQTPGGGVAPTTIDRSGVLNLGNVLGFNFNSDGFGVLLPGQTSAVLVVQTNAPAYRNATASVINSDSANLPTYAPAVVPEPSTLVLFGSALFGLVCVIRRRAL